MFSTVPGSSYSRQQLRAALFPSSSFHTRTTGQVTRVIWSWPGHSDPGTSQAPSNLTTNYTDLVEFQLKAFGQSQWGYTLKPSVIKTLNPEISSDK